MLFKLLNLLYGLMCMVIVCILLSEKIYFFYHSVDVGDAVVVCDVKYSKCPSYEDISMFFNLISIKYPMIRGHTRDAYVVIGDTLMT